jgi:hypothetical protein
MTAIRNQPLLWFMLIGALLFAVDTLFTIDRQAVYVGPALRQRLGNLWEVQTGQTPTEQELAALVENWIQAEVL